MDSRSLEPLVRGYLNEFCKPSRIEHSLSVAALASRLCARFGLDPEDGLAAGLAHDLMKDKPLELQWDTAKGAASEPSLDFVASIVCRMEAEKAFADKIIHGPAASVFLYRECAMRDHDMLEAVALHSSASTIMSPLAKILFVADKMEPRRGYITEAESEKADILDLESLLLHALNLSMGWLRQKNHAIAQSTIDLYNALTMREH
ncbi:MAG TPA: HD domain-containing protein [Rectinemataceae bacterium]|nr:HD domain-containing protein [Rectinemataceae bacterium]